MQAKLELNTPEGFRQYVDRLDDPDSFLERIEATSRVILREAGLPDDLKLRQQPDGRWSGVLELVKDSPGTPVWYAAELLAWIKARRDDLARGDSEGAAYCLAQIMQLRTHAGASQKAQASGAKGGTAPRKRRKDVEKRLRLVSSHARLLLQGGHYSRRALAKVIAPKVGIPEPSIIRALRELKLPRT